jgi:hypothetical protein
MKISYQWGHLIHEVMIIVIGACLVSCKKESAVSVNNPPPKPDTLVNILDHDTIFERGGSNYGFYSVGTYLDHPTQDYWNIYLNMRPVIGTYHLAPDTVKNQLAIMYANGQRRLALDLWFSKVMPIADFQDSSFCTHLCNSRYGNLFPQQQANLKALLHDIDHQGFELIVLRFEHQGVSDPLSWTAWDEDTYISNWSFITSTIDLIQNEISALHVKVIYDLCGELGGTDFGMSRQYAKQLWSDYVKRYGSHNTMGYSYATAPMRYTESIAVYDEVGVRPDVYGFDVYGDELATYSYLKQEIDAAGESSKPIIANEVYYNDSLTYSQLLEVRSQLHMNIKFLLEWPLSRAKPGYICVNFPGDFSAYDH